MMATVDTATAHGPGPSEVHVSVTVVPACAATGVNTAVGDVLLLMKPAPNPVHTPPVAEPPNDAAMVAVSVSQMVCVGPALTVGAANLVMTTDADVVGQPPTLTVH